MAKKPKPAQPAPAQVVELPIELDRRGTPTFFADNMIVQADGQDFELLFFDTEMPKVIGTEAQTKEQRASPKSEPAKGIVRVVVSAERAESIVKVLSETVKRMKEQQTHGPVQAGGVIEVVINGEVKLVDRDTYDSIAETAGILSDKSLEPKLRESMAQADRGEGRPWADVRKRLGV